MKKATLQADGTWKVEEFTAEETTEYNATVAHGEALKTSMIAAATKKATDAASGKTKLKELGLTDDQIAALVG